MTYHVTCFSASVISTCRGGQCSYNAVYHQFWIITGSIISNRASPWLQSPSVRHSGIVTVAVIIMMIATESQSRCIMMRLSQRITIRDRFRVTSHESWARRSTLDSFWVTGNPAPRPAWPSDGGARGHRDNRLLSASCTVTKTVTRTVTVTTRTGSVTSSRVDSNLPEDRAAGPRPGTRLAPSVRRQVAKSPSANRPLIIPN